LQYVVTMLQASVPRSIVILPEYCHSIANIEILVKYCDILQQYCSSIATIYRCSLFVIFYFSVITILLSNMFVVLM